MNQILHIFKKDTRRHWPEIVISLALLGLFARHESHPWAHSLNPYSIRSYFSLVSGRVIGPALVISWLFLVLRVIQSEPLVGDRQWWTTKPYVWWHLLLAKLFFIFVFISVPLFHTQLFLLHSAGFSVLSNVGGVFLMQFTLPLILVLATLALASLTKNLAQALLGIGIVIVCIIAGVWLDSRFSDRFMHDTPKLLDLLGSGFALLPLVVIPIWQFARRRTGASRGTLAACCGISFALSFIPTGNHVEQSNPLVALKDAPAQFSIPPIPESAGNKRTSPFLNLIKIVPLTIPIHVSGVAPGTLLRVDGIKLSSNSSDNVHWEGGWYGEYAEIWPEDQQKQLGYGVKTKEYEEIKSKPLNLQIQLLLSEYQESGPRTLVLPPEPFRDSDLGICRIGRGFFGALECIKPFRSPVYVARYDGANSPCKLPQKENARLVVSYSWQPPNNDFLPSADLNPIVTHGLNFRPVSLIREDTGSDSTAIPGVLCPGAEIQLSHPILRRQFRVEFDLPNTRLQDLEELSPEFGGATSYDLRSQHSPE
jgi:hypothetical protein